MYDYLVVGSGLYGAIFAHEAKALSTPRTSRVSTSTSTAHISSIPTTKKSGIISPSLRSSTALPTRRLPTTRASSTRCPSICILLIRCGVWSRRRKLPPKLRSSAKKSPASRRTWKNRPSPLWAATSMRSSSRATPRSSGAAIARICPPSSSSDCLCA